MWQNVIAIAVGGAIGSVMRYGVGVGMARLSQSGFPWGTLTVNVVGSFAFGLLAFALTERMPEAHTVRAFALVGLLGAFTTFSTFSFETLGLLQEGAFLRAAINAVGSVVICIAAAWAGLSLARQIF